MFCKNNIIKQYIKDYGMALKEMNGILSYMIFSNLSYFINKTCHILKN